jgi:hypothetical protein
VRDILFCCRRFAAAQNLTQPQNTGPVLEPQKGDPAGVRKWREEHGVNAIVIKF